MVDLSTHTTPWHIVAVCFSSDECEPLIATIAGPAIVSIGSSAMFHTHTKVQYAMTPEATQLVAKLAKCHECEFHTISQPDQQAPRVNECRCPDS